MQNTKKTNWKRFFLATFFIFSFLFAGNVFAQTSTTSVGGNKPIFTNPITAKSMDDLLTTAMLVIRNIVGIIAVFMIVVAGVIYMVDVDNGAKTAKEMIKGALVGLLIVLAAPTFLLEVYKILGKESELQGKTVGGATFDKGLYDIILSATTAILGFIGVLTILMIIIGGVMLITSGDSKNTERAKGIVFSAVIGLVIALLSLVIVNALVGVFS